MLLVQESQQRLKIAFWPIVQVDFSPTFLSWIFFLHMSDFFFPNVLIVSFVSPVFSISTLNYFNLCCQLVWSACQHQIAYILIFCIKQQLRGNYVLSYLKIQVKRFSLIIIPVTPSQWQGWGEWAQCSTSCGKGTKIRARACSKSDGSCPGEPTDTKYCLVVDCPGCAFCKIPFLSGPSLIIDCLTMSITDSCCWDFKSVILMRLLLAKIPTRYNPLKLLFLLSMAGTSWQSCWQQEKLSTDGKTCQSSNSS